MRDASITITEVEELFDRKFDEKFEEKFEEKFDQKVGILIEHMDDQFSRLIEAMDEMRHEISLCARKSDLEEVKSDIRTMKKVLKITNQNINKHDKRINRLERLAHSHA